MSNATHGTSGRRAQWALACSYTGRHKMFTALLVRLQCRWVVEVGYPQVCVAEGNEVGFRWSEVRPREVHRAPCITGVSLEYQLRWCWVGPEWGEAARGWSQMGLSRVGVAWD